MIHVQEDSMTE